ncbi:MAG TPA: MASE1 domain-containing protein [Burkholderiales bacterium]|nr:MASE1 domain-containing protein [Burkholderiales bacterium]
MKPAYDSTLTGGLLEMARLRHLDWRPACVALIVGVAYYLGAKVGLALTFQPVPISVLWPPNAVLLAALVLAPRRWWLLILLGALPAHFVAESQAGVPAAMVLCWFVSNVSEALIGAIVVRHFMAGVPSLDSMRNVAVFVCGAAVLAPFLSSFLDAAFVRMIGWGESGYRELWTSRFVSNVLATLTFVPVVITWAARDSLPRIADKARCLEGVLVLAGLLAVGVFVFDWRLAEAGVPPTFLYLPLPFLLWGALRFGPRGASLSFTTLALLAIWGAAHERGPFVVGSAADNALSVQLFLISVAIPLLVLAAVMEERKATYRRLRQSEERFATIFRSSPDAIAIIRRDDGQIIEVNDRWQAMFGHARDDVLGRTMTDLSIYASEDDRRRVVRLGADITDARTFEMAFKTREGDVLEAVVSTETVEIEGDACLIKIIRDITPQRRAELEAREQRQQLTHLSRVATVSDFSGALAHELNQPLTAILSNAQAGQRFLALEHVDLAEIRSILWEIVEADKRAGNVIRRLRVLMKKGENQFAPVSLNPLLREVLEFAHSDLVTRNVEVTVSFGGGVAPVSGDRVQLQQLMLNLIGNACEALDANDRADRKLVLTTTTGANGSAQVIVSDCGPGIAPATLERLFEPFFTTKEHGLGLGLSICRTIATAHGGMLHAENNPDRGATFRVVFPPPAGS